MVSFVFPFHNNRGSVKYGFQVATFCDPVSIVTKQS